MLPSCKVIYCSERTSLFLTPKQRTSKKTHNQFFWVYFNLEFVLGFLRKSEKTGRKKLASRRLIVLWLIISNVSEAGKKPRCSSCCWKYFGLPTAVATRQPVDWRFIETPKSPFVAPNRHKNSSAVVEDWVSVGCNWSEFESCLCFDEKCYV